MAGLLLLCGDAGVCDLALCGILTLVYMHSRNDLQDCTDPLTQLANPELEHRVLARQHLRLGLVEDGVVARAAEQEIFGQRA